jgi:predicted RNase H-like HicB family nuclease
MTSYVALLDGKAGAYGMVFPDLPGCTAMGSTFDEAWHNGIEAIAAWIGDADAGEIIPTPRSLEALRGDAKCQRAIAEGSSFIIVPLLIESGRSVRANISMDQGILEAIDTAAKQSGLTRSSFLASAAKEKILSSTH